MRIINEISRLTDTLSGDYFKNKTIGLVPTMGALHNGHLELVKKARKECDVVVCSIYVNPTQFNNTEDLVEYPRTLENDVSLLEKSKCDIVFCPDDNEMFIANTVLNIDFGALGKVLEGEFRPGHFNGVGLIVSKLFNIVQPNLAYFGQKDLQQFAIIDTLVKGLNFNIKLKCVPTVRDNDGLALSSRNKRLSTEGIQRALLFNRALLLAKEKLLGNEAIASIIAEVKTLFEKNDVELEYFKIVNKHTFEEVNQNIHGVDIAFCIAGYIEGVRLIDNLLVN